MERRMPGSCRIQQRQGLEEEEEKEGKGREERQGTAKCVRR